MRGTCPPSPLSLSCSAFQRCSLATSQHVVRLPSIPSRLCAQNNQVGIVMQIFMLFLRKLRILVGRGKFDRELDEEMSFHREQAQQKLLSDSMPAEAALHAARRQFGNETRLKERSHEIVGFRLESVWQDFRFAVRQLCKNPGFACVAILMLAIGICACVSIFAF